MARLICRLRVVFALGYLLLAILCFEFGEAKKSHHGTKRPCTKHKHLKLSPTQPTTRPHPHYQPKTPASVLGGHGPRRTTKTPCTKHKHLSTRPTTARVPNIHNPTTHARETLPHKFSTRHSYTKPSAKPSTQPHKHTHRSSTQKHIHPSTQRATKLSTHPRTTRAHSHTHLKTTPTTSCQPTNCVVSKWSDWSSCPVPCGNTGEQQRNRQILTEPSCGGVCTRLLSDTKPCNRFCHNGGIPLDSHCRCSQDYGGNCCEKVHGNWSPWEDWEQCSKTCGTGLQQHRRTCTNPSPANGGRYCTGPSTESRICTVTLCPVDGSWSPWRRWSDCSVTCSNGIEKRLRSCTNPSPANGGLDCPGSSFEARPCNKRDCPVNGVWSPWGGWSPCTSTCGDSQQFRLRFCNNPFPSNGGKACVGLHMMTRKCNTPACLVPVNGGWSGWGSWSPCTKTCGAGQQVRMRECKSPQPANGGQECQGVREMSQHCNIRVCIEGNGGAGASDAGRNPFLAELLDELKRSGHEVNKKTPNKVIRSPSESAWSEWTGWSACSVTCGDGQRFRSRVCNDSANQCTGVPMDVKNCYSQECPP